VVSAELEQRQQVIQIEMRSESGGTSAASSVGSKSPGPCYSDSDSDDDDVVQGGGVIVSNGGSLNLQSGQKRLQQLQVEASQPGSGSLDRTLSALDLKAAAFD
jgi:hypothetical protein